MSFQSLSAGLYRRSVKLTRGLEVNLRTVGAAWILLAALACTVRLASGGTHFAGHPWVGLQVLIIYAMVIGAPMASLALGLSLFKTERMEPQPALRLAQFGRWRKLDCLTARSHSAYGNYGFMASLLVGLLLNVPVRTMEFLTAVPALGSHPPGWFATIFMVMTADVIIMSSLYMFAFAMAIRRAPLFPRFLLLVWGCDLLAQILIADAVMSAADVPHAVAVALETLLTGNVKKVLISVVIWLPYLLLSERVNVTFRHRAPVTE